MTESETESESNRVLSRKETAQAVSARLEKLGATEFKGLTTDRFDALAADSFGILRGIANGMITTSQPRLRDNLIEMYELFCAHKSADLDEKQYNILKAEIRAFISMSTHAGLSLENNGVPLETNRLVQR